MYRSYIHRLRDQDLCCLCIDMCADRWLLIHIIRKKWSSQWSLHLSAFMVTMYHHGGSILLMPIQSRLDDGIRLEGNSDKRIKKVQQSMKQEQEEEKEELRKSQFCFCLSLWCFDVLTLRWGAVRPHLGRTCMTRCCQFYRDNWASDHKPLQLSLW